MSIPSQEVVNGAESYVDTWRYGDAAVIALFQRESLLAEAVSLAINHAQDPAELSVISLGRGAGPEVDSILALANTSEVVEEVTATGLVVPGQLNPSVALTMAQAGRYPLINNTYGTPVWEAIRSLDFFIGREEDDETGELTEVINAKMVRLGHEVAFLEENPQFEPFPSSLEPADLVTCNGLLRYLSDGRLAPTVDALSELTREGGVLALGVVGMPTEGRSIHANMGQGSKQALHDYVSETLGMERLITPSTDNIDTATVQFYTKPATS